jgi:ribose transport system permease protein
MIKRLFQSQLFGLGLVISVLFVIISFAAPQIPVRGTNHTVNSFLRPETLIQLATDTSFFAILAVGMSLVMLSGGIDLSVGSTYALSGVLTAMALQSLGGSMPTGLLLIVALGICLGIGLVAGLVNGSLVVSLGVHPFVVTVGTMWVYRGIAFVTSKAQSINMPEGLTEITKSTIGLPKGLYPIPTLVMAATALGFALYLHKTIAGRNIYAVGGNADAAHFAGIRIPKVLIGVYSLCGLTAALSAYLGATYYGAANSADGQGYELYAIASAVVGGVSLNGGRGTAFGAVLGALLIATMRQAISTLSLNSNYEYIIIGSSLVIAVFLDHWGRKRIKG